MFPELLSANSESVGILLIVTAIIALFFGRRLLQLLRALFTDAQFIRLLGLVVVLLLSGAQVYHRLEGWSYLDSLYFTVITLTTVGYGDFSPQTSLGKVFSMIYILLGLGVLGAFIAIISQKSQDWSTRQTTLSPHATNSKESSP